MALLRIKHMPGDDLTAERGSKRVYVRTYTGISDRQDDDNLTILLDPLTPKELDPDPFDPTAFITSVKCKRRSAHSLKTWDITVTSSTEVDGRPLDQANPLNREVEWESETVLYDRPIIRDIRGKLITNTAGDIFEGAMAPVVGWTFTGYKNLPIAPLGFIDDFVSCVNDATVTIDGLRCAPKTVWFRSYRHGRPQKNFGQRYRAAQVVMEYNPGGWWFEPLNRGYREMEEIAAPISVRRLVEIEDDNGRPVSSPVFLNERGAVHRVEDSEGRLIRKVPLEPSDIITLQFEIKKPMPFRRLNIL